jgi:hypothetical protein
MACLLGRIAISLAEQGSIGKVQVFTFFSAFASICTKLTLRKLKFFISSLHNKKRTGGTVIGSTTYYPAAGAMRVNGTLYFSKEVYQIVRKKDQYMWQSILRFLFEWFKRPSWLASIGIVAGFLLFLVGIIWRVPRERKIGLFVMGLCIVAGVLLYYFG